MCKHSDFERPPTVTATSKYALLSKGSPIVTVMCKCLAFTVIWSPTATEMCKYSVLKKHPPTATVKLEKWGAMLAWYRLTFMRCYLCPLNIQCF